MTNGRLGSVCHAADANGQGKGLVFYNHLQRTDRIANRFGFRDAFRQAGAGKENTKLFATQPANETFRAYY